MVADWDPGLCDPETGCAVCYPDGHPRGRHAKVYLRSRDAAVGHPLGGRHRNDEKGNIVRRSVIRGI